MLKSITSLLLCLTATTISVSAQAKTNNTVNNKFPPAAAVGTFDLAQVLSSSVGGFSQIQCGTQSGDGFVCPNNAIVGSKAMMVNPQNGQGSQYGNFMSGNIPVWVIYFGNQHQQLEKTLIEHFVGNIGNTAMNAYWQSVMNYNYPGKGFGGNPHLGGTYQYDCTKYRTNLRYCDIKAWDEDALLTQMFRGQIADWTGYTSQPLIPTLPYSTQNIYLFVGGTDTSYTSEYGGTAKLGASGLCGRKDKQSGALFNYRATYIYTQITKAGDTCNIIAPQNSPNNNLVDNTILIINHELIEAILSTQSLDLSTGRWFSPISNNCEVNTGQNGWAPGDVCAHLITNLVPAGNGKYFNLALNGQKYTVSPVWDNNSMKCTMGANPTRGATC